VREEFEPTKAMTARALVVPASSHRSGGREPGRALDVQAGMKRVVAKCSAFDISVIVPVCEALAIPPHGANIIADCAACHARHRMQVCDMRMRDDQRAA
jgi:cytochrome c553